jgi:hypothetical protein
VDAEIQAIMGDVDGIPRRDSVVDKPLLPRYNTGSD